MFWGLWELNTPVPAEGFGHREAAELALEALSVRGGPGLGEYIVINTARSSTGSSKGSRWVVLCNRPSGDEASAVIVELSIDGSSILGFRRPGESELRDELP